jgi:glycosyltransferase involved in cell wall biosynthesis
MLKVLSIVDKERTAIDRLAQGLKPYFDSIEYNVISVHPKRPDPQQLADFERLAQEADIIDYQYFRTAEMLRERYPWLKNKKSVLTHYNPYSITESDWDSYDKVIACNKYIASKLPKSQHISLAIDSYFWKFKNEWEPNRTAIMVANRIESKKGILEAAIACGDAGLRLMLVGAISDRNYFEAVMATECVEYHDQISDEELRNLYYKSTIHICNSVDGFESGTLPILEAMMCGVPVVTRSVGHVPDLYNEKNLTIFDGEVTDVVKLTETIKDFMNDKARMIEQRDAAWQTVKSFNNERRAYEYMRVYRSLFKDTPVSVIVPIYDKPEIIRQCLTAIADQEYGNIELVVCDDGDNKTVIDDFARTVNFPVKYIRTMQLDMYQEKDYGLARARNMGAIEATSDILIFCDQRMIMQPGAIMAFASNLVPKTWLYGNKGAKKEFVENFSCISRTDFVECGMFNERINLYGGMSQEIRSRIRQQGFRTGYQEDAKAIPAGKSRNKYIKRDEIIKMKNLLFKIGL